MAASRVQAGMKEASDSTSVYPRAIEANPLLCPFRLSGLSWLCYCGAMPDLSCAATSISGPARFYLLWTFLCMTVIQIVREILCCLACTPSYYSHCLIFQARLVLLPLVLLRSYPIPQEYPLLWDNITCQ